MIRKVIIAIFIFICLPCFASDNFINSVILSETDGNISVTLRTDKIAKVKKNVISQSRMVLTLKGVKQTPDITTLYKNISDAESIVIQNLGNDTQILIEAPNITKSDVIIETPDSSPIKVLDSNNDGKLLWSFISLLIFVFIGFRSKLTTKKSVQKDINEIIKEREKELYRNFQKEVATIPSMNYKLKGYSKHVLKGETLRSYESRMTRI